MTTKYFVDNNGAYLGAWDGSEPTSGAIEVPFSPEDARQVWNGRSFNSLILPYNEKRRASFPSIEEQLDNIYWDWLNGTTTWVDKVSAIKAKYPKPI